MLNKNFLKILICSGAAVLSLLVLLAVFIRYQGFQYWAAYTDKGFATARWGRKNDDFIQG